MNNKYNNIEDLIKLKTDILNTKIERSIYLGGTCTSLAITTMCMIDMMGDANTLEAFLSLASTCITLEFGVNIVEICPHIWELNDEKKRLEKKLNLKL